MVATDLFSGASMHKADPIKPLLIRYTMLFLSLFKIILGR